MKFKTIIPYLGKMDKCKIEVIDPMDRAVIGDYKGYVIDIPWIYLEYYLYNCSDYEAIGVFVDKDGTACLDITICEPVEF